ncbi:P-loop NTPase family protein [Streptomyces spororaveus]|uniref:hypothetical protein n=1 Tax=Streptomyces spororaveus TaxID=284039 RepID=UPI002079D538|nr:hypothetical protein [Streptomyces spororaveus]MCM9082908.1 hypothetical protein [Streptomyces spororaveus]
MPSSRTPSRTRPTPAPLPQSLCRMLSGLSAAAVRALGTQDRRRPALPEPTAGGLAALLPELSEAPSGRLDYRVPLIAPMKAGKSTLLNAIVCQELLPSRGPAMTVLPTRVVPVAHHAVPGPVLTLAPETAARLDGLADRLRAPGRRAAVAAAVNRHPQLVSAALARPGPPGTGDRGHEGTATVRRALAGLNDLLRLALLALPEEVALREVLALHAPEAVVPVPWLASAPEGGRLVLVDTPGPDEELLPGVLNHFVAREVRHAHEVLVVRDATRRGSTAEACVDRLLAEAAPGTGAVPAFTVLNRADLIPAEQVAQVSGPAPAAADGAPGRTGRTAARQALAAASVLWPRADSGHGENAQQAAVIELLRGLFPLDWEDRVDTMLARHAHAVAQRAWDRSGMPSVMTSFVHDRGRAPGGWALARLLARLAPLTGPPPPPRRAAAPRTPLDDLAVLADRRQRVADAARSHFAGLAIEWR